MFSFGRYKSIDENGFLCYHNFTERSFLANDKEAFFMLKTAKRLLTRVFALLLAIALVAGFALNAFAAASPQTTVSAKATLAYTLKGLPLGRAVQNFYIGPTYIYATQRVNGTTYLNRLKIEGNTAVYKDRMTFNNCGHGQSLDCFTYNGTDYFWMGCKSDAVTTAPTDYCWSLQIARIKYEAGKTYDYTDLNRLSYMNYANKTATSLGTTYRVACGGNSNYTIFRIQTTNGNVTWSIYDTASLNALLDKSESVSMKDAKSACKYTVTQTSSTVVRPNGSFQGVDLSTYSRIYTTGGAEGDVPMMAKMNHNGTYLKLAKITNVGNHEIEGVQYRDHRLYFLILPTTDATEKKNNQQIWYLNESVFCDHSYADVAAVAATCTTDGHTAGTRCSICYHVKSGCTTIAALGHTTELRNAKNATCTATGYTGDQYCTRCNTTVKTGSTTAMLPHTEVVQPGYPATCIATGLTEGRYCSVCSTVIAAQTTIPIAGHTHVVSEAVAPTCTAPGLSEGSYCSVCNEVFSVQTEIPALGHSPVTDAAVAPTCTENGLTEGSHCETCGEIFTAQEVVPATGHSAELRNVVEGTCVQEGYSGDSYCSVCDTLLETGESTGFGGHTVVVDEAVAPTCLASGLSEGEHCSACGVILKAQEAVARLGHDYSYTDNGDGTHTGDCTRCDKTVLKAHEFTENVCVCGARDVVVDESLKIYHTLDLASDISVSFVVPKASLANYDSYYLECTLPEYGENGLSDTSTVRIEPVENGNYYYFTLTGITAVRMGDMVDAVLHMTKDGQSFISKTDSYSVATYAYAMLGSSTDSKMLTLCADLLRYGAEAQSYKNYRTDSLVDAAMTEEHRSYLSDAEALSFAKTDSFLGDVENPAVTWVGKTLDLGSKVGMKFVFNAANYTGDISALSMKVSYKGGNGEMKTVVLTGAEAYNVSRGYYAFTFYGLLASELRTVVDVAIFEGDIQLSESLRYSPESYAFGNTEGALAPLCKALFAYSDSAKAFFTK